MAIIGIGDGRLPWIQSGMRQGMSANAIQRSLKGTRWGIRRKDLLDTIRWIKGKTSKAERIRYVRKDYRASEAVFEKAIYRQRRRFMFEGRIRAVRPETGEEYEKPIRIGMDEIEAVENIEKKLRTKSWSIYREDIDLTVERAWKKW